MNHILFYIHVISFITSTFLYGAYLVRVPQIIVQPDGEIVRCFASGDEFYHWLHDADGYTIVRDPRTGYFVYAKEVGGALAPSKHIVSRVDPEKLGLRKFLRISQEEYLRRRDAFLTPYRSYEEMTFAPNTGTLNNVVVFIRFNGEDEFGEPISNYENMFNNISPDANSMIRYYREVSYNQLTVQSTFYPVPTMMVVSYEDTYPRSYYQPYHALVNPGGYQSNRQLRDREHTLIKNAIAAIGSQVPESLDLDADNDGYVDNVCFVVQGSPDAWADLLWPHMWALYSQEAYIHGIRVWEYNLQLQTLVYVGVLCHEMFHTIGAPDLYHYNDDGLRPVGEWDIMEWDLDPPQHMGAYMKYRYGTWISSVSEITMPGEYTLHPLTSSSNNCYKIASPYSSSEYFMVEYRRQEASLFEASLPGTGLLVYRINTALDGKGNQSGPPDEVYIYRPNGTHFENGNVDDAAFSSDVGRTRINDTTNPSSFLSDGSPGGLDITWVGSAGDTLSFLYKVVLNPDFTMVVQPTEINIMRGYSAACYVSLVSIDKFSESVSLSVSPSIPGLTATFFPTVIDPITNSILSLQTSTDLEPGTYELIIMGTHDGTSHSVTVTVHIMAQLMVWPGDANNDGTVNQVDLLPIGVFWNQSGYARTGYTSPVAWESQICLPWSQDARATYADATGDGLVGPDDVLVIGLNWNRSHDVAKGSSTPLAGLDQAGRILTRILGSSEDGWVDMAFEVRDVQDLIGVAWEFQYPSDRIQILSVTPGEFLGEGALFLHRDEATSGKVGIAGVRLQGNGGISGGGCVAVVRLHVDSEDALALTDFGRAMGMDENGAFFAFIPESIQTDAGRSATEGSEPFCFYPNVPNPFNAVTTLRYYIPEPSAVIIRVYDVMGNEVVVLTDGIKEAGRHQVSWNGTDASGMAVSSGVYYFRIRAGGFTDVRKGLLLK